MRYDTLTTMTAKLPFIDDQAEADPMIKSVVGHLASRLEQEDAERLTAYLPDALSLDRVRGQETTTEISLEHFLGDLQQQFDLQPEQADQLARHVLGMVFSAVAYEDWEHFAARLPRDWADYLNSV